MSRVYKRHMTRRVADYDFHKRTKAKQQKMEKKRGLYLLYRGGKYTRYTRIAKKHIFVYSLFMKSVNA